MKETGENRGERLQKQLSSRRKMADAVITVEASFVMVVVLFICGALISQGFYVHERNTGMLILMDTLEQTQTGRQNTDTVEISERWGNRALSAYYRCGGCKIEIVKRGSVLTGSFKHRNGKTGGNVQMRLCEPERFLRMVRAGGI